MFGDQTNSGLNIYLMNKNLSVHWYFLNDTGMRQCNNKYLFLFFVLCLFVCFIKAEFDAGLVDLSEFENDVHIVTGK